MKLVNRSNLDAFAFRQFDAEGDLDAVVAVRGRFRHVQDGPAQHIGSEGCFVWADRYDGDPQVAPLLAQTDLTPEKPGADVTFLGESFAPTDARDTWECGLTLGPIDKRLRVTGPRFWQRDRRGWSIGAPEGADSVPVDWRLASGGPVVGADGPDLQTLDPRNPVGLPRPAPDLDDGSFRAPQILGIDDIDAPAGLGPVAPFWARRSRHAGTYDDDWKDNRHPLLPRDFDPMFWSAAPEGQFADGGIAPDAAYRLDRLHPDHAIAAGTLPGIDLAVQLTGLGDPVWHVAALDGVQFDWRADDLIELTWRIRFPLPDARRATLTLCRVRFEAPDASATGRAA